MEARTRLILWLVDLFQKSDRTPELVKPRFPCPHVSRKLCETKSLVSRLLLKMHWRDYLATFLEVPSQAQIGIVIVVIQTVGNREVTKALKRSTFNRQWSSLWKTLSASPTSWTQLWNLLLMLPTAQRLKRSYPRIRFKNASSNSPKPKINTSPWRKPFMKPDRRRHVKAWAGQPAHQRIYQTRRDKLMSLLWLKVNSRPEELKIGTDATKKKANIDAIVTIAVLVVLFQPMRIRPTSKLWNWRLLSQMVNNTLQLPTIGHIYLFTSCSATTEVSPRRFRRRERKSQCVWTNAYLAPKTQSQSLNLWPSLNRHATCLAFIPVSLHGSSGIIVLVPHWPKLKECWHSRPMRLIQLE